MNPQFRGGNSRLLTRALEQKMLPTAVLDAAGTIVYVNGRLCELMQLDSTLLVGKECSWKVPQDREPAGLLLSALAPPESAREGAIAARKFATPPIYGSDIDAQLFIPLTDDIGAISLTIVLLGRWEQIQRQLPQADSTARAADVHAAIVQMRAKHTSLDNLDALYGTSPLSRLAMQRSQLATQADVDVLVSGPEQIGKSSVVNAIYGSRLAKQNIRPLMGTIVTIDGEVVGVEQVLGQLEVLLSRFRPEAAKAANSLYVRRMDLLDELSMSQIIGFVNQHSSRCTFFASVTPEGRKQCESKDPAWRDAFARIGAIEIDIPALAERREDLPLLTQHTLAKIADELGQTPHPIRPTAMELLSAYPWPRNFAELDEVLRYAAGHCVGDEAIDVTHLPIGVKAFPGTVHQPGASAVEAVSLDQILEDVEREVIRRALDASPRNRAGAARLLGISRPRLLRRIELLGLSTPKKDPSDSLSDDGRTDNVE